MAELPPRTIPEDAIRLRSYLIWQREDCPQGAELDHWLRAKAELERELRAKTAFNTRFRASPFPSPAFVVPRVPISVRPSRTVSTRISPEHRPVPPSAATR